jgi:ATP-binding cassette subfamily B protein
MAALDCAKPSARYASFVPYVLRQWKWLLTIFVLTALASGAAALQPWPMKLLVDYALDDVSLPATLRQALQTVGFSTSPVALILFAAAASIAIFVLNSIVTVALSTSWSVAGQRMVYEVAGDVFAHLQRLSLLFHSRRRVGDSLSRLTEDSWCIYSLADGLLMAPLQHTLTLAIMIWIGFALDPLLASLAIAVAPLLAASSWYFGPRLKRRSHLGRDAKSRLLSFVHQTLGALPVVQAFATEKRNNWQFQNLAGNVIELEQRGNLLGSTYGLVNGLLTTTGLAIVLYVGATRVVSGEIPLGTLLIFVAYVRQMQGATGGLFQVFAKLKSAQASIERLQEVLHCDDVVSEPRNPLSLPATRDARSGHIQFENVTFGYEPERAVLKHITLEARPGEMIALVGATGAGKSTLVSLVPRFFDPWQGRVTFDGIDIRQLKLSALREAISIVLQEPFLLPLTIAENIAYGRPDASTEQIIEAAVAARADGFISRLPNGYDTPVGEMGATLSLGEQQRLSVARALLKDAPVLILDEPTSALDAETETMLLDGIQRLMHGRTTLTIAHRLSTIQRADRIAVLEQGRIIACGDYAELAAGGAFAQFIGQQLPHSSEKVVA